MPELELALTDLGRSLDFPPAPELAPRVRARLAEGGAPRRARPYTTRRALALAVALFVMAIGAVMAVPQTRAAILEFLHLRGVTIERVGELPTVPIQQNFNEVFLGERVSMEQARRAVHFPVVVPAALGDPDEVYLQRSSPPGGMVSFVYGTKEQPRVLFTQFEATVHDALFKKVAVGTTIDRVRIDGAPGFWIGGAHVFDYFDRRGDFRQELIRLAGKTLLWERGRVTLRLEADVSEGEALKIARSVR